MMLKTSLKSVVLVCKDCRKRSKGPTDMKPKEVMGELRSRMKDVKPRPRVVFSSCLGLCPKRATGVVLAGAAGEVRAFAVETAGDLDELTSIGRQPE